MPFPYNVFHLPGGPVIGGGDDRYQSWGFLRLFNWEEEVLDPQEDGRTIYYDYNHMFRSTSWDPTGNYVGSISYGGAVGAHNLFLHSWDGEKLTELMSAHSGLRPLEARWHPKLSYFAIAGQADGNNLLPRLKWVRRDGDSFIQLADPLQPTGATHWTHSVESLAWHPNGDLLIVGYSFGNRLAIYKLTGEDVLIKLPDPVSPGSSVRHLDWDHTGNYIAMNCGDPVYFSWYKKDGDALIKLPFPSPGPTWTNSVVKWHRSKDYLAVITYDRATLYRRDGDVLTQVHIDNSHITADMSLCGLWLGDYYIWGGYPDWVWPEGYKDTLKVYYFDKAAETLTFQHNVQLPDQHAEYGETYQDLSAHPDLLSTF